MFPTRIPNGFSQLILNKSGEPKKILNRISQLRVVPLLLSIQAFDRNPLKSIEKSTFFNDFLMLPGPKRLETACNMYIFDYLVKRAQKKL